MTVDRYTKFVLTVIAVCSVINVINNTELVKPAMAQTATLHVIVDQVAAYAFQGVIPIAVHNF